MDSDQAPTPSTKPADSAPLTCPYCGSTRVREMGLSGSQLMTRACYCQDCSTPFETARKGLDRG